MNRNLLILGAVFYGAMAREVAEEMRCFEKISFLDDRCGDSAGGLMEYERFPAEYPFALAAVDDAKERVEWLQRLERAGFCMVALVSSSAWVSPSAHLMNGTVVGPGAVIQAEAVVGLGCMICAGAVIGRGAFVGDGGAVGCHGVVRAETAVPAGTGIGCGEIFHLEAETALRGLEAYSFEVGV